MVTEAPASTRVADARSVDLTRLKWLRCAARVATSAAARFAVASLKSRVAASVRVPSRSAARSTFFRCAGALFTFFAAVPYTFQGTYGFSIEESGLIFVSIVIGCLLGTVTVLLCDVFFYRKQIPRHPQHQVPPEYRLLPAMIGSLGLPVGLFWFGWTARRDISWASPAVAIVPFAWGNICIFISTMQ